MAVDDVNELFEKLVRQHAQAAVRGPQSACVVDWEWDERRQRWRNKSPDWQFINEDCS